MPVKGPRLAPSADRIESKREPMALASGVCRVLAIPAGSCPNLKAEVLWLMPAEYSADAIQSKREPMALAFYAFSVLSFGDVDHCGLDIVVSVEHSDIAAI